MKQHGDIIHSERDQFGLIQVIEDSATRKLFFDSHVEQSCQYLNAPLSLNFEYQQKIVAQILDFAARNKRSPRILMLGLGGGSIAAQLNHCLPKSMITVIELRQAVIDCAYRFFQLPQVPEIEVLQDDALQFVAQQSAQAASDSNCHYDVIIVDIFDAEGLANELSSTEFNAQLWQLVNQQQGMLLFNLWHQWQNQPNADSKKAKPTQDSQQIIDFWQKLINHQSSWQLNRYNIQSSQNLIVELCKMP